MQLPGELGARALYTVTAPTRLIVLRQVREAQGIKDTDEDRRRDRNRQAMADAYDKTSMKVCALAVYTASTWLASVS